MVPWWFRLGLQLGEDKDEKVGRRPPGTRRKSGGMEFSTLNDPGTVVVHRLAT